MKRSADVIITGAGPAGAATALLLARAGVDVLLLDRAPFPRPKPCGDCLSIGATAVLDRLGILDPLLAARHARLRGWRIVAPNGSAFHAPFSRQSDVGTASLRGRALSVERSVLDALILDAAIMAGARIERQAVTELVRDSHGCVTGVLTRAGTYTAAITVGADGLRSIVAMRLGAVAAAGSLRKLSLTWHLPVQDADLTGEMHTGDGICAGLAPIAQDGVCNITIVANAARFGRTVAHDPAAFAHSAIESLPRLRGRVPLTALRSATPLASGPFDRPVRRVAFDGAVLVGDAAGYYDPFTGQGVYQALASAELLAPAVEMALRTGNCRSGAFRQYAHERTALLRGPRFVQRGIEFILCRPALANRAIARIRRAPDFGRAIISVTGDIAPARALLSRRALSGLLFAPTLPENSA
ncbi:MAG: FAD-dependent monooxygenase [Gemmatimonadetes bacterium]|nr:FAD-dependent monooxygenase [Gemmatimonadota bacterium]